jgi:hypothetical protein
MIAMPDLPTTTGEPKATDAAGSGSADSDEIGPVTEKLSPPVLVRRPVLSVGGRPAEVGPSAADANA